MNLVIKKRVSLGFLGDEYKDAYLTFKAVPVDEYKDLIPKYDKADKIESINQTKKLLQEKFIEGEFPVNGKLEKVEASDIGQLDENTLAECLAYATGQKIDPKPEGQ